MVIKDKICSKDNTKKDIKTKIILFILSTSLFTTMTVNAQNKLELLIKLNVEFQSQNIMQPAFSYNENGERDYLDFWYYANQIKNIYIQNEIQKINSYTRVFDVTIDNSNRVKAYLSTNKTNTNYYDLYIQADGIIYMNEDASYYFANMNNLSQIDNIYGLNTSNVTNMSYMFYHTGYNDSIFKLDIGAFDTSNVTNMSYMFYNTGFKNPDFTLDVSKFDTSNVTNMSYMFYHTGYNSKKINLDVRKFNTGNVTNMSYMFYNTAYNNTDFTLDLSNFDTNKAIDMDYMLYCTGYNSTKLNTSITLRNPNTKLYNTIISGIATKPGTKLLLNYTKETEIMVNNMKLYAWVSSNIEIGSCVDCGENYIPIGSEININGEKFNIINQTDDTVTMLAKYNLGTNYRQNTTANKVSFSNGEGWEHTPGPKEIDVQIWSTNPKSYINNYVNYLKEETGDTNIIGSLITLKELESLGCTIPSDYKLSSDPTGRTCTNSTYKSWLINNQWWWTRSARSDLSRNVWIFNDVGALGVVYYGDSYGIRPTITISKETLKNLN